MSTSQSPETYVITAVKLADCPGGAIATVALRKQRKCIQIRNHNNMISLMAIETKQHVSTILNKVRFHLNG